MTAPTPHVLAAELRLCADLLDRSGPAAVRMAEVLAARGFPSHGDGGTPPKDLDCGHLDGECECGVSLTSTEAAALSSGEWDEIDRKLAHLLTSTYGIAVALQVMVGNVTAHADPESTDRPNRQPGSGACLACDRHCSGASEDRLRSGFCSACRMAWTRAGSPDRSWWMRERREELAAKAPVHIDPTVIGSPA